MNAATAPQIPIITIAAHPQPMTLPIFDFCSWTSLMVLMMSEIGIGNNAICRYQICKKLDVIGLCRFVNPARSKV
jgi:hypothetical protein